VAFTLIAVGVMWAIKMSASFGDAMLEQASGVIRSTVGSVRHGDASSLHVLSSAHHVQFHLEAAHVRHLNEKFFRKFNF
jgi:hypothetical protein